MALFTQLLLSFESYRRSVAHILSDRNFEASQEVQHSLAVSLKYCVISSLRSLGLDAQLNITFNVRTQITDEFFHHSSSLRNVFLLLISEKALRDIYAYASTHAGVAKYNTVHHQRVVLTTN